MLRLPLALLLGSGLTISAFAGGTISWPTQPLPPDANPAATATAPIQRWLNLFHQNVVAAREMKNVDIIFDGDNLAITAGQYGPHGGMWQRYTKLKAVDFSSPGDTTQSILWRLQQGQADGLNPKLIVLTVGGSNLQTNTPEQVVEAVKAIIVAYRKACPDATILVQGVFPRGEKPTDLFRAKITAVNQQLASVGDGNKVIFLDFSDKFLQPDGTMDKAVMADFVHPSPKGYGIWADAIQPVVDRIFPPASLPAVPASSPAASPEAAQTASPATDIFHGGTVTWPPPSLPPGANSAAIPTVAMSWLPHLQQNIDDSRKMPQVDLIFDGDSITAGWRGGAGGLWNKRYGKLNAFDFGISGDSTTGLLWRVENGQVEGLHPKLIVLLIGTNNMYANSVEQIAGGIKADVAAYRKLCPDATILVQGILPRGEQPTDPLRAKVKAVNKIISALDDGKKVIFIDWGDKMLLPDGRYTKPTTGDFLHPNMPGYIIWADSIQPYVDKYVGVPPASPTPAPGK